MTWLRSFRGGSKASKVRIVRRILEYGVFFGSLFFVFNLEATGSLVHRWLHLDGWKQNVLVYVAAMAFVLVVNELWRRIDRRIFGPAESTIGGASGVAG
jgi:hypothetical protein